MDASLKAGSTRSMPTLKLVYPIRTNQPGIPQVPAGSLEI
jgi:hypothetical protein